MKVIKNGLYAVALVVSSQSVMAAPFAYEARSLGMGNIGVATADIATAPFANPAMLSFQRSDDDFSLLLGVGCFFSDNDGMIDDIDSFQAANDRYDAAGTPAEALAAATDMLLIAGNLSGKVIAPELSSAIALGFSGETYSMSVSARKDVIIAGGVTLDTTSVFTIVDPALNTLNIFGVQSTEVGFSISRSFDFMESKFSIGVTPKVVSVDAIDYSESLSVADTGASSIADTGIVNVGDFTTLDVGVVMEVTDNIQLGLVVKNLISEEMTFLRTSGGSVTLSFDTELKLGVAYTGDIITIGADLDVTENDSMLSGFTANGLKRKNLSVGLELNAFDFVQLRVGMIKNMASGIPDDAKKAITTAGIGFWLGFNLDIAAMKGEGDSIGAFVQAGFKF
ncbi:MAG: conjugal transfer protein TraF [Gammaproteobacteria bacterium]|nr:conjugal transfer protein TraF [Gammaproteobacteria bacterium]